MQKSSQHTLDHGFIAFHGNRAEDLAEVVIHWMQRHPLKPLEEEVILVQSNGMAEWIKMEIARLGGVCAATRVELPARFIWRCYRQVLGRKEVPAESPLDKLPMVWRLMQLLPSLLDVPAFAPVKGFLTTPEPGRMLQLCTQLADLFDQYQNYRADWLEAWSAGQDHLVLGNGKSIPLPADQAWQAFLWRAILETLDDGQRSVIRPRLHQRFLDQLAAPETTYSQLARRVVVFGMSQIPWPTLQALAALGQHCQVILAIPNPCRYYWGDIMDGRELFQTQRKRQAHRPGQADTLLPLEDMHAHAHPLLAAWGRQGRDFIRQLDAFDDHASTQRTLEIPRVDYFDTTKEDDHTPLLQQVQLRIRDLTPLCEHPQRTVADHDQSIVFHTAHSMVRELEVLHDQLLKIFANPPQDKPLQPRDVVVMVPDISSVAPSIEAVFGQYRPHDARYIPFDIADMSASSTHPLFASVDWLMRLPQKRCRSSELIDLLEVSPIALRFGIDTEGLSNLSRWMREAGIRWGLHQNHRQDLDLGSCGDHNSAWFGIRRMLLGFANGSEPVEAPLPVLSDIEPYPEVGGLEASLAGALAHFMDALTAWHADAMTPATPEVWAQRCRNMVASLVQAQTDEDREALQVLDAGLQNWQAACEQAGFADEVPLPVARSAWMDALEVPALKHRFRSGGVTFCTLMPMRAIPFEMVCLLGMNDGDYPRSSLRNDFDLMAQTACTRPGDRSRRQDDRQLMLEALLSARRVLYVSWCGNSVRDNSQQQPSVLVSQLRDYLSAGWGAEVAANRTTRHPLQPFSRRYFEPNSTLFTYAKEWRSAHATNDESNTELLPLEPFKPTLDTPLNLQQLSTFLRNPVKAFFRHRLQVQFNTDMPEDFDDECFDLKGLDEHQLIEQLLQPLRFDQTALQASPQDIEHSIARLRKAGTLPLAAIGQQHEHALQIVLTTMLQKWQSVLQHFPDIAARRLVQFQAGDVCLQDWIEPLRHTADGGVIWLDLLASKLSDGKSGLPRADKLLSVWVRSLALAANGISAECMVVGRDSTLTLKALTQEAAQHELTQLLQLWQRGMDWPLPLPPKTAIALVASKHPLGCYEGGFASHAENEDPCLARLYPDYASLMEDGQFEALAQQIYAPFTNWIKDFVTVSRHTP